MLKLATKLLIAFALVATQVGPSFAAPAFKHKKYKTVQTVVYLSKDRFEEIKKQRKDIAQAYSVAKERGTKLNVSHRDARWLMAESRKTEKAMTGAGFEAAVPIIVVAVPIIYRIVTGRDLSTDFPALTWLVCVASMFYPPLASGCPAMAAPARGPTIHIQPANPWTRWWSQWFAPPR
jgi:hypothetical protein